MNKIILLKLLTDKEYYEKYRDFIKLNYLSSEEQVIIKIIDYIFKINKNINTINKELLVNLFNDNYNNKDKEFKDSIYDIINNIYNTKSSLDDFNIIIINILKKHYLENIINKSIELLENPETDNLDILDKLLQEYKIKRNLFSDTSEALIDFDVDKLLEIEGDTSGFDWFCEELTDILGKIKGGDLGLIVASVNTGKTAFVLTIAMSLVKQGAKVLHINNEERGTKVMLRALENYLEMNKLEINNNKDKASEVLNNVFKNNYFLYDMPSVTIRDIKTLIEKHEPDVILIDQAWKIKVSKQDRNDLTLTEIFKNLRELAKEFQVHIIGTTQADSSAYDKEWIKLDNLFGSKVGVQGELDYLIGIGKTDDISKEDWRYLSFPKNKLTGNESSRLILKLDKSKSKYYNNF